MALGEILKNARVQRGLTPSDVAESTHMMVQIVEDLEREDFRRVAAPIYGRGFVKLYAELLELDPEPLVRDFMELYAGARAPAVRAKRPESPAEAEAEAAPLTRTVNGIAPVTPQRQTVQARPAVRPLSAPQPEADRGQPAVNVPGPLRAEKAAASEAPQPAVVEKVAAAPEPPAATPQVVEPEAGFAESDEPDLFSPQPPRRKAPAAPAARKADEAAGPVRKPRLPVFKIGGRLEEEGASSGSAEPDEAARERMRARIQAFVNGITQLKAGVERKLPAGLPYKRAVALGALGVALLTVMGLGVHVLFKMTGSKVKEAPSALFTNVPPPPDLYVD